MRFFPLALFATAFTASIVLAQYQPGVNNHVTLLGRLDRYGSYSNIWGYTDGRGNEYALLGADAGLSIINITNPTQPVEVAFVPGPNSSWREIKTYSHYAYVVSEGTSPSQYTGIQVVDLSKLPNAAPFSSVRWPNVTANSARAHSVAVDDAGYLYIQGGTATAGTGGSSGGIRIFSLVDPAKPAPVGFYNARYVHDSFTRNNILFNSNIQDRGRVDVLDIADRSRPRLLTSIIYPRGSSHNSGTTVDGNYLITTDEANGYTVKFWDVRALWDNDPANDGNIRLAAEYLSNPGTIAHNVHVRGQYAFLSHYEEGVRVLDVTDPTDPAEVGYYDTPSDWGVYPYFPSGNFVVSDIPTGLYVFRFDSARAGTVQGKVTNRATGEAVAGATLHFPEADKKIQTDNNGGYRLRTSVGLHRVVIQAFSFRPDTSQINLASGAPLQHDRALQSLLSPVNEDPPASEGLPTQFHLSASYPNPFRIAANAALAVIRYQLPRRREAEPVTLRIYDVLGRQVATLVDGEIQASGFYRVAWDGRDQQGALVRNGIYFYQLRSGNFHAVHKLVVVR